MLQVSKAPTSEGVQLAMMVCEEKFDKLTSESKSPKKVATSALDSLAGVNLGDSIKDVYYKLGVPENKSVDSKREVTTLVYPKVVLYLHDEKVVFIGHACILHGPIELNGVQCDDPIPVLGLEKLERQLSSSDDGRRRVYSYPNIRMFIDSEKAKVTGMGVYDPSYFSKGLKPAQ